MTTEVCTLGTKKASGLAERKRVILYGLANNTLTLTKTQTGLDVMEAVFPVVRFDTATAVNLALTTFNVDTAVISAVFSNGDSAQVTVYAEVLGYRTS